MSPSALLATAALLLFAAPAAVLGQSAAGSSAVAAATPTSSTCGTPPAALAKPAGDFFNAQQEQWLGDAEADGLERNYRPVRDAAESEYLQHIADRLAAQLPPSGIHFKLLVVDTPEVNGYSLAGGHIYLTRKLIAAAQNEDEVAGVIGHEMGHILSHQLTAETSENMARLLHISSVGDRADVFARFQQLIEAESHDAHPPKRAHDEEFTADQVGVFAVARAGYRPQAYAELWNRAIFVKGRTGNRWTDLFGMTKPSELRLRHMQEYIAALPPGCGSTRPSESVAFEAWHQRVVANQRDTSTGKGSASAVALVSVPLNPPLSLGLDRLRFSPDGKYALAQDESSVFVLTVHPFANLFRFDADNAGLASFAPDSQSITFSTPSLHVERWNISRQIMAEAHEVSPEQPCLESVLSPDGETLVCVTWFADDSPDLDLRLLQVATGQTIAMEKHWARANYGGIYALEYNRLHNLNVPFLPYTISPSGQQLLIGQATSATGVNFATRSLVKIGNPLRTADNAAEAFVGEDRVLEVDHRTQDSGLFHYPDGKQLVKQPLTYPFLESVSRGDTVLVRGMSGFGVGIADVGSGKYLAGSKSTAADMWDREALVEGIDGSVLLESLATGTPAPEGSAKLPLSRLGALETAELSPDGKYLAISGRSRGGIWNTETGTREFLLKGFEGASWTDQDVFTGAFKLDGKKTEHLVEVNVPTRGARAFTTEFDQQQAFERGVVLEFKKNGKGTDLIAHAAKDNAVLWTRTFSGAVPALTENLADPTEFILSSLVKSGYGRDAVKADDKLTAQLATVKYKEQARLVEWIGVADGVLRKRVVIETPATYLGVAGVNRVGDLVYVHAGENRTMVYSIATGEQKGEMFGSFLAGDPGTGLVCLSNRTGELVVYSAAGVEVKHLSLGMPLRFGSFSAHGTRLLVLTADQRLLQFAVGS